ncbi:rho GTPase-activating protein 44-like [Uloborus diversus]|uniref:rho GTPase-activating protein 44-like n=1 Tax=Uloborus diversus TaxID=327109 RepID=UPI002409FA4B|nr:rho GTPase-activating protein 44-like [Uloborus diversus]
MRNEKSSVLTEELNAAEKRVDLIKESCYACGKKLSSCMQRLTQDSSDRRNSKKLVPESALAQCMEEWGLSLGENSILGMTLVDFARIQDTLATDLLNYKVQVEESVVEPLQNILNIDISKIIKSRKQLTKLSSDMDSAKTRYQSSMRSSQQISGNGQTNAAAKVQLLREESEDLSSKVEQCRDSLTAEMFHLISREPEMSEIIVRLCELQLEYHRKAFYVLESVLPELKSQISDCPYRPVFGVPIEEHLKMTKREIATVIETCVCWLLESAMEEEGLFRIGGSMLKIKKMKSAFDAGLQNLIEEDKDPHNVAGVLKLYLRSLPEPLLTYQFYDQFMEAAMEQDHDVRLRALWSVVNSLPETHFKNLRYLIKFFARLCQNSDVNKMSVQNIAIVMGPNLIWPQIDECALGMNMTATNLHSQIVDSLITYSDWFFPGECEFYISTPTSPRHIDGFPPTSLSGSQLSLTTAKLSNGDSAVDSMSSSPTNSSPKSPSPRIPIRPRKKPAPKAPSTQSLKNPITRSLSCGGFQANVLPRASIVHSNRLSQLSLSHEDLLNAKYNLTNHSQKNGKAMNGINSFTVVNNRPKPRPKPPRNSKNGLPPVAEKVSKTIERPTVPPPERPDSYIKSGSASTDEACGDSDKILELDDISISLTSSGSETYNDCQMSFADDSDCDEKYSRQMSEDNRYSIDQNVIKEEKIERYEHTKYNSSAHEMVTNNETLSSLESEFDEAFPCVINRNSSADASETTNNGVCTPSPDLNDVENDCHFVGGTPTWFEHYGDDKRQSTLWFSSNDVSTCFEETSSIKDNNLEFKGKSSQNDEYRTVIEVGNNNKHSSNSNYQETISGTAIKLRVNSESQNTRL